MSFLISYSSQDDRDPKKWIVKFHEDLKNRLNTLSGRDVKVMLDKYDHEDNLLEKGLREMIEQIEGLVAVLSPSYINNSKWCEWERKEFIDYLSTVYPDEDPKERLFAAVKLPKVTADGEIDLNYNSKLPSEFERLKKYQFFAKDEKGNVQELLSSHRQFKTELNALAHQLLNFLEKNAKQSVYLAQTIRPTGERVKLLNELMASGYNVIPRNDLDPDTGVDHQQVARSLSRCIVSIHLVTESGPNRGLEISQIEAAQRSKIPVLIWNASGTTSVSGALPVLTSQDDYVEGPFQDFTSVVADTLKTIRK
jgi:hypothetical protein